MPGEQTPINGELDRPQKLPTAVESAVLAFKDRVLWPLEDNLALLSDRGRIGVAAGSAAAVGAVVAAIVVFSGSGGSSEPAAARVALASPPGEFGIPPAPSAPAPTLHGAAPTFKAAPVEKREKKDSSEVDSAEPVESAPLATSTAGSASAATDRISSRPSSTTGAATSSAEAEAASIPGPEAGAKAVAVARQFSDAFVVYETGGEESEVGPVFAATATPELSKALLKRPPRLPADVKVPKARVLNIVAGPSREGVFTLSVSLLRLGVTSELRLEMERIEDEGWRVTNVLG